MNKSSFTDRKFHKAPNTALIGNILGKVFMFGLGYFGILALRVIFNF